VTGGSDHLFLQPFGASALEQSLLAQDHRRIVPDRNRRPTPAASEQSTTRRTLSPSGSADRVTWTVSLGSMPPQVMSWPAAALIAIGVEPVGTAP
jgi:hypothetical protein